MIALTNYEMITQLSAQDLAKWYDGYFIRAVPYCKDTCPQHDDCEKCLLDWLVSEYDPETINQPETCGGGTLKLVITMFVIMFVSLVIMICLFKGGGTP